MMYVVTVVELEVSIHYTVELIKSLGPSRIPLPLNPKPKGLDPNYAL